MGFSHYLNSNPMRLAPFLLLGFVLAACGGDTETGASLASQAQAPVADATLFESSEGGLADGAGPFLFAGRTGESSDALRRAVLRFELSGPEQVVVGDLSLQLTITRRPQAGASTTQFSVYRLLEPFSEGPSIAPGAGGGGGQAQIGDTTWLFQRFDTQSWGRAGGVFSDVVSGSASVGAENTVLFESNSGGLERDVEGWMANPEENFGWILIGDESRPKTAIRFASRENSRAEFRPALSFSIDR